jgi:hypothetical protein
MEDETCRPRHRARPARTPHDGCIAPHRIASSFIIANIFFFLASASSAHLFSTSSFIFFLFTRHAVPRRTADSSTFVTSHGPIVVVGEMCGDHRRPPRPDFLRGRGRGRTDPGRPAHQLARTLIGQRFEPALPGWAATNDGSCLADGRLMTVARMKNFVFFFSFCPFLSRPHF